jgi:hypothetical protein
MCSGVFSVRDVLEIHETFWSAALSFLQDAGDQLIKAAG